MGHGQWFMMKDFKSRLWIKPFSRSISIQPHHLRLPLMIKTMNKLMDINLFVMLHSWDGFMIIRIDRELDVFMLNKLRIMKMSKTRN